MRKWNFLSFLQLFWKKWEFRIFFVQIESPSVAVYFSKKIKTCSHASQMRLKAKKSQFSSVLTWFVRCKNFFCFLFVFFPQAILLWEKFYFFTKSWISSVTPPLHSMFKNMRIWWFEWKCWYCAPGDDSKRFRKCVQLAPKWSKRVDWTGFWSRWVRKYLKMNFRKHTHPL